jgi:hypothetical protein
MIALLSEGPMTSREKGVFLAGECRFDRGSAADDRTVLEVN